MGGSRGMFLESNRKCAIISSFTISYLVVMHMRNVIGSQQNQAARIWDRRT